jgi:hypothetical protein
MYEDTIVDVPYVSEWVVVSPEHSLCERGKGTIQQMNPQLQPESKKGKKVIEYRVYSGTGRGVLGVHCTRGIPSEK